LAFSKGKQLWRASGKIDASQKGEASEKKMAVAEGLVPVAKCPA